ncbi:MAG TPA: sortase [Patescibacteria group bacterium]|nr:sortase [Patescibacteria group bacterium]
MGVGLSILLFLFAPILLWYPMYGRAIEGEALPSPIQEGITNVENSLDILDNDTDGEEGKTYKITIEKLGILDAEVRVGAEDLDTSLIQFPGTALPGKIGNSVIFGHSVLPYFYNPKSYKTIFSTLHLLTKGDLIRVEYDGVQYMYRVEGRKLVSPKDYSILSQPSEERELSLVTCVPPGIDLGRLVISAKLLGS